MDSLVSAPVTVDLICAALVGAADDSVWGILGRDGSILSSTQPVWPLTLDWEDPTIILVGIK